MNNRERAEKLNKYINEAYPDYYGAIIDLPNGDREYQPFKEKEYDEFVVTQLEAFARETELQFLDKIIDILNCGGTSCPKPCRAMCKNEEHKAIRALKEPV